MKTVAQQRLEQAAAHGTIVVGPDMSHAIHHSPANKQIELSPDGGVEDTLVGKAAARLADLLRPLTEKDKLDAGIAPCYGQVDTYHIPNVSTTENSADK